MSQWYKGDTKTMNNTNLNFNLLEHFDLETQVLVNGKIQEKRDNHITLSNLDFQDYSYESAVYIDLLEELKENFYLQKLIIDNINDIDAVKEQLNDTLWTNDIVTGNGSGSYFFNSYISSLAVFENLDEIAEICKEYGFDIGEKLANQSFEELDVIVRCYYLDSVISEVIDVFFEINGLE